MLTVDCSKCTKCGICVSLCPFGIVVQGDDGFPEMDAKRSGRCVECGHCVLFCPTKAVSMPFLDDAVMQDAKSISLPTSEEALNLLKTRRTTRRFKKEPVSREVTLRILDAVNMAPSARNARKVRYVISEDPVKTKEITNLVLCWYREEIFKDPLSRISVLGAYMLAKAREGKDELLRGAPNVALAVIPKDYMWQEDGAISLTYFELAAHALGIGACWGGFLTAAVRNFAGLREYLGISDCENVCGAQMFGYPEIVPARQFPNRGQIDVNWL